MEKATLGFRTHKIWQILKCFAGTFCRAQILKLGGVSSTIKKIKIRFLTEEKNSLHCVNFFDLINHKIERATVVLETRQKINGPNCLLY